jgi:hypothetical protein
MAKLQQADLENIDSNLASFCKKNDTELKGIEFFYGWVDACLLKNNFILSNLSLNCLWIYSQLRINPDNKEISSICNWLFLKVDPELASENYEYLLGIILVAEERMVNIVNRLPSINSCLTNSEREKIELLLQSLHVDDRSLNFKESEQYLQLQRLSGIPIANVFLDHFEILLDSVTDNSSYSINEAIIAYILTDNDVIKDSHGLLGLVDDLYALESVDTLNKNSGIINRLQWEFELANPDFRYPVIIDQAGNNLINKIDPVLKSALSISKQPKLNNRLIVFGEVESLALLSSILGTTVKLEFEHHIQSISNTQILQKDTIYLITSKGESITLKFSKLFERGHIKLYMFQLADGDLHAMDEQKLNACNIKSIVDDSEHLLSTKKQLKDFESKLFQKVYGIYPFGLANNLDITFKKTVLVTLKKNIDKFLATSIEGKTILEWFGCIKIGKNGQEERINGILSDDPLLITSYSMNLMLDYLESDRFMELSKIHSINYVPRSEIDYEGIAEIRDFSSQYAINTFVTNLPFNADSLCEQYDITLLEYRVESESSFHIPPDNNFLSNVLSKVGTKSNVHFIDYKNDLFNELYKKLNFKLDDIYISLTQPLWRVKQIFLRRIFQHTPLSNKMKSLLDEAWGLAWNHFKDQYLEASQQKNQELMSDITDLITQQLRNVNNTQHLNYRAIDAHIKTRLSFEDLKLRLKLSTHAHASIEPLLNFLELNGEDLFSMHKIPEILSWLDDYPKNSKILLSNKDLERVLEHSQFNKNLKKRIAGNYFIGFDDLKNHLQTKHLLVPSISNNKIKELIVFPYTENIYFLSSEFEQENYLNKLFKHRDNSKSQEQIDSSSKSLFDNGETNQVNYFEEIFLASNLAKIYSNQKNQTEELMFDCSIILLDSNRILCLPQGGKQIISADLDKISPEEKSIKEIEEGDNIILPNKEGGSLQDSILDIHLPNFDQLKATSNLWRLDLSSYIDTHNLNFEDMELILAKGGVKRKSLTIKNWLKNPTLVAPQNYKQTIPLLANILAQSESHYDETIKSIEVTYKARDKALDILLEYLEDATLDLNKNFLKIQVNNKEFSAEVYEVITVEHQQRCQAEDFYKIIEL